MGVHVYVLSVSVVITQRMAVQSEEQLRMQRSLQQSRAAVTVSLCARSTFTGTCAHTNTPHHNHGESHGLIHLLCPSLVIFWNLWSIF